MILNEIYYTLKPLIPRPIQIGLRRRMIRQKRSQAVHAWPINEEAAAPPVGWSGWPEGKRFALVLTHDVESARGQDRCRRLMEMEERLGFRSSFEFTPEQYPVSPDLRYELAERGFEVGLHGLRHDANLFRSRRHFRKQAAKINATLQKWGAVGFRSPSMYHNLDWIHDLNIEYDASTFDTDPFEPQPDGMATIFPFWVQGGPRQRGYVELPYTLPQDFTLFILMKERTIEIWKRKLDWIAQQGGMALLIVHPDYMHFAGQDAGSGAGTSAGLDEYPADFYEEFLEYVRSRYGGQYWQALPKEVARFWWMHYAGAAKKEKRGKIRACMLAYSFYESDNRVRRYAETLAKKGHDVDVIALQRNGLPGQENISGVNVYRIQERVRDEKGRLSYLVRLARFLSRSARFVAQRHAEDPYHLIHVHSVPDFEVFSAIVPKLQGAKIVLDIHDIVPEFYASKFCQGHSGLITRALMAVEKASIRFSDHVIISNHLWEKTLLSRSAKSGKCSVIMNYPDPAIFYRRPRRRNDGRFVLLYPGSLGRHQGLDIAIKALAVIGDQIPGAELHIYGNGPERGALQELAKDLGLAERVLFHDVRPIDEIADLMAEADLGVVPKRDDFFGGEAFSTKTLEFMSLGVPVIVSETRIDRYYFNDSVVRFFRPEDEEDLARGILQLAGDKDLRERQIEEALRFVVDFSWKKRQQDYLRLVYSLTSRDERD